MTRFDSAKRKTQSIARLMAEEAFSRPAPKPASNVPVVKVIGRKLRLQAVAAPSEPPPPAASPTAEEAARKPRVFVIRQKGDEPSAPEATPPQAPPRPVRTRRRNVAPVRVIYSAPERPPVAEVTPPPSLDLLAGSLAGIEPTLEMIRRAMAFDFSDPAIMAEWEQLSRTAGELSELIAL